jgi:hypothetical protein
MTRTCSDCPSPISTRSKGRCRSCTTRQSHSDPAYQAHRIARLKEATNTPEIRAARSELAKRFHAERALSPEWAERRRALGFALGDRIRRDPKVQASVKRGHVSAAMKRHENRLGWCPVERLDEYRKLRRKVGAVEARRIIEAETPGTLEHARRTVANNNLKMDLRHLHDRIALGECAHR